MGWLDKVPGAEQQILVLGEAPAEPPTRECVILLAAQQGLRPPVAKRKIGNKGNLWRLFFPVHSIGMIILIGITRIN